MGEQKIDPERLAALVDGRLSMTERAALLKELDASDEGRELLAEVMALHEEMGAPAASNIQPKRSRWVSLVVLGASGIAASIALAVFLPQWQARSNEGLRLSNLVTDALPQGSVRPQEWKPTEWSSVRADLAVMTDRGRAVRIGVRLTDLAYGVAHDSATAAFALRELRELIAPLPASAPALQVLTGSMRGSGEVERLASAVVGLVDSGGGREGAWLEAARLAAYGRRPEFFAASRGTNAIASDIEALTADGSAVSWARAIALIDSALATGSR